LDAIPQAQRLQDFPGGFLHRQDLMTRVAILGDGVLTVGRRVHPIVATETTREVDVPEAVGG
jgi:hypothetical protein